MIRRMKKEDLQKFYEKNGFKLAQGTICIPESTLDSMGQFLEAFDRALDDLDKSV